MGAIKYWTEIEDNIIKEYFEESDKYIILDKIPNRSWGAICQRAKIFNLYRNKKFSQSTTFKRQKQEYIVDGNIVYLILKNNKNPEQYKCKIDIWNLEKVLNTCTFFIDKPNAGHKYARGRLGKRKIYLHRLIMNVIDKPEIIIDHINGDTLNCLENNLRKCTQPENIQNKFKALPCNKSGVLNVHTLPNNKYHVVINRISFGRYWDLNQATLIAKQARAYIYPYSQEALTIDIKQIPEWIKNVADMGLKKCN